MNKQDMINLLEEVLQHENNSDIFTKEYPWAKVIPPTNAEDKFQGGLLESWWDTRNDQGEVLYVSGFVYNDSRWRDGTDVRTSYVVNLEYDEDTQTGFVETRNTVYKLGRKVGK